MPRSINYYGHLKVRESSSIGGKKMRRRNYSNSFNWTSSSQLICLLCLPHAIPCSTRERHPLCFFFYFWFTWFCLFDREQTSFKIIKKVRGTLACFSKNSWNFNWIFCVTRAQWRVSNDFRFSRMKNTKW